MALDIQKYARKTFTVEAVQVTDENLEEVADWCDGLPRVLASGERYIKVQNVLKPSTQRQSKAFVGDWILYSGKGFKVYLEKAFPRSFEQVSKETVSE